MRLLGSSRQGSNRLAGIRQGGYARVTQASVSASASTKARIATERLREVKCKNLTRSMSHSGNLGSPTVHSSTNARLTPKHESQCALRTNRAFSEALRCEVNFFSVAPLAAIITASCARRYIVPLLVHLA